MSWMHRRRALAWAEKVVREHGWQEDARCQLCGKHGAKWQRPHDCQEWTHVRRAVPWCGVELGEEGMYQVVAGVLRDGLCAHRGMG